MTRSLISHSRPWIIDSDINAVRNQLAGGALATGSIAKRFSSELSHFLGEHFVSPVGSGALALELILRGLEVKAGDEVIIPSYVCEAVAQAIKAVGAVPVLADLGIGWTLDPGSIKTKLNNRTAAVVLVHTFGIDAWVDELSQYEVPIIEDCCQAFGINTITQNIVKRSVARFYSLHATKCLTAGEGGVIATSDPKLCSALELQRKELAYHYKFNDLQAALGSSQLSRYSEVLNRRKEIANFYFQNIAPDLTSLIGQFKNRSIFFRFPLTVRAEYPIDKMINEFAKREIAVRRGVDELLHLKIQAKPRGFPNSEDRFNRTLSIPIYPALTDADVEYIVENVNDIFGQG